MKKRTIIITTYCPEACSFCSSSVTDDESAAVILPFERVVQFIEDENPTFITISGGEPQSHPEYYKILRYCQQKLGRINVELQTCAIALMSFNSFVLPEVKVYGYAIVGDSVTGLRVVQMIPQGRQHELEVTLSRNLTGQCNDCNESVLMPNGSVSEAPCRKYILDAVDRELLLSQDEKG